MNLFLSIHQFHLEYRKYNSKISQNREKRNKRKRQKRKLNSTYAQWNERQTCLKTNSVNYTRSMFLLFRTNKAKRRYCREQKRETVVEHREALRRGQTKRKREPRVPRTLPGIRISRSTRAHKAADTRGSGRYARFGSFRANGERRPWQSAAIKGTLMERFDCRTDQLPFSFFLFFLFFFLLFSAFFPFFQMERYEKRNR